MRSELTALQLEDRLAPAAGLVRDINTPPDTLSSFPSNLTAVGSLLFFTATTAATGEELWVSDGTSSGTILVKDIRPGSGSFITNYRQAFLTNVNGVLYFAANDGTSGTELWRSDGTSTGTVMVRDINTLNGGVSPSIPQYLNNVGGVLYFLADDGPDGQELWRSDGTSAGTALVKDIRPGGTASGIGFFANVNGILYFQATDSPTTTGAELWRSDGTSAGTFLVKNIRAGNGGSGPCYLANVGGTLLFSANDGTNGYELWRSDGTSAGTILVKDIRPGTGNSFQTPLESLYSKILATVGGTLYFQANDGTSGKELWKSDGTSAGTTLVKDIRPGGNSAPLNLTNLNGSLFFRAQDGTTGYELWRSDGTSTGTVLFDIRPGSGGSFPRYLTNTGGVLYFQADISSTSDKELWRSDGTSAGTVMDTDIYPGPTGSAPQNLTAVGNRVFFSANTATTGRELFAAIPPDTTPPTVTAITSPSANGTYTTGQSVIITVTFSEPVVLTGTLTLTLDSGASVAIPSFSGTSANATYTIQAGETSPDLTVTGLSVSGTLVDLGSNAAVLTLPASNLGVNANIIVNPLPPTTVSTIVVNLGAVQRSQLTRIDLTFNNPVNAATYSAAGAISLTRTSPGSGPTVDVTNGLIVSPNTGTVSVLTLTFANISTAGIDRGSLTDGRWQLNIPALGYTSPLNDPNLRRLLGDATGDGTIDGNDLVAFGNAFGTNNPLFDFNYDGTVDGSDLVLFGNRFGTAN